MAQGQTAYNQAGKRYYCTVCGSEFVVTRAGQGQTEPLSCHGRPLEPK